MERRSFLVAVGAAIAGCGAPNTSTTTYQIKSAWYSNAVSNLKVEDDSFMVTIDSPNPGWNIQVCNGECKTKETSDDNVYFFDVEFPGNVEVEVSDGEEVVGRGHAEVVTIA